jgi:alkylation response protein AidB-like acyl-CoA dehydrogenase
MELLLDPEHSMLAQSARSFAARAAAAAPLRGLEDLPGRLPAAVLGEAAAAGFLSLLLPEDRGGSALGPTELCLVAEELGAALSALPVVPAVAALSALAQGQSEAARSAFKRAAAGAALVVPAFHAAAGAAPDPLAARGRGAPWRLFGTRVAVPFASAAAGLVVDCRIEGDPALVLLPCAREGLRIADRIAVDGTVLGELRLDDVSIEEGDLLARGAAAAELRRGMGIVLDLGIAAELIGLMRTACARTLDYLRTRQQFGRPIGSFQALQHRAVDDHLRMTGSRSLLYEIARGAERGEELAALACAAQLKAGDAALAVLTSAIQMHGAIGFTEEHDIGLMLKRAMTLNALAGARAPRRAAVAAFLAARSEVTLPQTRPVSEADAAFRAEVRDWLARTLPADLRYLPARPPVAQAMWWHRQLHARGWIAPRWPKVYGGMEASLAQQLILAEELGRAGAPELSGQGISHIGPILMAFGSEEQKTRHLPGILSGDVIWCQGYSEPGAGSDLASLRTAAVLDGDHLVVDGQKIWTTWGHYAQWMYALVRTDPAAAKQAGITFLMMDMATPGITVRSIRTIAGEDELAQVFLDGVRVPLANVVGAINDGWRIANALLAQERLHNASPQRCVAVLGRLKRAAARGALVDPVLRDRLAEIEIETLALVAGYQQAADLARAGRALGPEAAFLKLVASELTQRLAALLLEVCGSDGALEDVVQMEDGSVDPAGTFLQVRRETIFAGSSEIQRNIIAKRVLSLP